MEKSQNLTGHRLVMQEKADWLNRGQLTVESDGITGVVVEESHVVWRAFIDGGSIPAQDRVDLETMRAGQPEIRVANTDESNENNFGASEIVLAWEHVDGTVSQAPIDTTNIQPEIYDL